MLKKTLCRVCIMMYVVQPSTYLRVNEVAVEALWLQPDLVRPPAKLEGLGLNGGAVPRPVDLLGDDVPVEVSVGVADVLHRLVGEGDVTGQLVPGLDPNPVVEKGERGGRIVAPAGLRLTKVDRVFGQPRRSACNKNNLESCNLKLLDSKDNSWEKNI